MRTNLIAQFAALLAIAIVVTSAGPGIVSTGPASAASSKASCAGIEFSSISPPGTSDEDPGGASQAANEIREFAGEQGIPPGAIVSFVAGLHEGSHEACDEAIAE